ncbi:MAG: hypothetical protein LLG14_16620 [Nocardiaceae bacterium]|nr:hypothetical protein [Nocardiaceae bacterium]
MAYDALVESITLIESRTLAPVPRLSRRRRFVAMAVDVAGDTAATMFLRRGVGCVHEEIHVLALRDGQWRMLGGGGGSHGYDEDLLTDRPRLIPEVLQNLGHILSGIDPQVMVARSGPGGILDSRGRHSLWPWHGRWISYSIMQASAQVESVHVGDREIAVPWHGQFLTVWAGRRPPKLTAYDGNGNHLGTARIPN